MASELKSTIHQQMKLAMKAKDKSRLGVIRLMQSEFKRMEVDKRIELDDAQVLVILDKMVKQRRDSAQQYQEAGRQELADQENFEIAVISEFLPQPMTDDEVAILVEEAIVSTDASSMQGMGQVMALLKPKLQGRADMARVSELVKHKLTV